MSEILDTWLQRWPHFRAREILSPDGITLAARGVMPVRVAAMNKLEAYRYFLKIKEGVEIPLLINHNGLNRRGFRSAKENHEVQKERGGNGWDFSFHCQGAAFDISSSKIGVDKLYDYAKSSGLWNGIIRYSTWIHVDDREIQQYWKINV